MHHAGTALRGENQKAAGKLLPPIFLLYWTIPGAAERILRVTSDISSDGAL